MGDTGAQKGLAARSSASRTGFSQHSPCSSLLAAARRVDEVLAASALGVPGRLVPFELPPEGFRSLLGGVFFFCRGCDVSLKARTSSPPGPGLRLTLTAMNRAEEVSLSMSLSSELSDSSLLSASAR